MPRWTMVIDVTKCNGCTCCSVNCTQTNELPAGFPWRRIPEVELPSDSQPRRVFLSMACMHCENPPCLDVCPSGATHQRPDGIVDIHNDLCLGCGYCVVACPYYARTLIPRDHAREMNLLGVHFSDGMDTSGICTKCNFCRPKIDAGLARGLKPGLDPEASPACMNTCASQAIHFGDGDDPQSNVSRLIREREVARIHEELGTKPSVYYLIG